ncbi:MAG: cupin domain-containing protein [Anaerolineae bacterium]|nr:cupin domain-containing protein [Anaerolineae bacterium]
MHPRAAELIETLDLQPHPEGGDFAQVYRSPSTVTPDDDRDTRVALTTIYFLLTEGQTSAWHRVRSDEVWHFYEGEPLALTWADAEGANAVTHILGPVGADHTPVGADHTPVGADQRPVAVVPAGCWQTARPPGAYALVGCTVARGFEYDDFELVADGSAIGETLRQCLLELSTGS